MVFYRKYRPQTISELDSAQLRDKLYAILSKPSIPHAYLFTGPKGTGKTSTARIIAKIVNCERNGFATLPDKEKSLEKIEPCNECESCVSITNGTNIDVLEIDGASNRGIDEIRDLREKVRLSPAHARMKVYIIDEVHMLTTEAFNALLKTIEEPPVHVMFIFCTTEPQKVPDTIVSRCTHIALTKGNAEEVVRSLSAVAKEEKLDVDPAVFSRIAMLADGGFRDAKKIFEELVATANGAKITLELLEKSYHVASLDTYAQDILQTIFAKQKKIALEKIEKAAAEDIDIVQLIDTMLTQLHEQLLSSVLQGETSSEQQLLPSNVSVFMELLMNAKDQSKRTNISQLPLELAVMAYLADENEGSPDNTSSSDVKTTKGAKTSTNGVAASGRPTVASLLKKQQMIRIHEMITPKKTADMVKKVPQVRPQISVADQVTLLDNLIHKIRVINNPLSGVLRSVVVKDVSSDGMILVTKYAFHKERLEDKSNYEIIEKAVRELTGKELKVMIELNQN